MRVKLICSADSVDISGQPSQKHREALTLVELLVVIAIVVLVLALMSPLSRMGGRGAREAARRVQCLNNLKQIAIALRDYEKIHGALPPAYTTDETGKPLHSWRTLILPFLEEQRLYDSIDLKKPWDDPVNAEAAKTNLPIYLCPSADYDDENRTAYLAVVTPDSAIRATEARKLSDITDALSQTLTVIEVDEKHAVPWMSPIDADESVVLGLGEPGSKSPHPAGMNEAFADGHVDILPNTMSAAQRRALISMAGNDKPAADEAK